MGNYVILEKYKKYHIGNICDESFKDIIFGDLGFSENYCDNCVQKTDLSIHIRNLNLKYENIN